MSPQKPEAKDPGAADIGGGQQKGSHALALGTAFSGTGKVVGGN